MNTAIKFGAVAVGGYLLYQWFLAPAATAAQASGTPSTSSSTTVTQTQIAADLTTRDLVAKEAADHGFPAGSLLNADGWNYYYQHVRGVPGPDLSAAFPDPSYKMTIDEWWAAAHKSGVAGLGGNYMYTRRGR